MKKTIKQLTSIVCLLLCILSVHAKKRVIDWPDYEVRSSGLFEVSRVELDQTETRVHIKSTFLPNWWIKFEKSNFISPTGSDEKIYILDIINGEFDKEIFMPASGDSTFILIFPPLDKKIKKIDFGKTNSPYIFGVSLDKPKKKQKQVDGIPAEIEKWLSQEIENYPSRPKQPGSFFTPDGKMKLIGYIKGFDPRFDLKTGMIYAANDVTGEDLPIVVEVYPDGRFEAEIPAIYPKMRYVTFNRTYLDFYGEPGQVTCMILDWNDFLLADRFRDRPYKFQYTTFRGPLSRINEELALAKDLKVSPDDFMKKVENNSYTDFKNEMSAAWENIQEPFRKLVAENDFLPETKKLIEQKLILEKGLSLMDFVLYKSFRDEDGEEKEAVPEDYYDFLQSMPWDVPEAMAFNSFSTFMNRFEYMHPFRQTYRAQLDLFNQRKSLFQYLEEEEGIVFSEEELLYKQRCDSGYVYKDAMTEEEWEKYLSIWQEEENTFHKKYEEQVERYADKYERIEDQSLFLSWQLKDSILQEMGVPVVLISELYKTRGLEHVFSRCTQREAKNILTNYLPAVSDPFFASEAERLYAYYFLREDKAYELPEGRPTEMFRKIIDPFKGKYLLVDFWGIFCGPCIQGIKHHKEARERLKDDPDMAFLFITSEEESPTDRYEEFVKEQELEHTFRLSGDDYKYLRQLFRFNGIPRYIFVDREGRILDNNYSSYSFESDVKRLLKEEQEKVALNQ